jgi:hypothetical protein
METLYHPVETCKMGQGKDLKIYGVDGLRVCSASVFLGLPSGYTVGLLFYRRDCNCGEACRRAEVSLVTRHPLYMLVW